jgi:hypothetical protein
MFNDTPGLPEPPENYGGDDPTRLLALSDFRERLGCVVLAGFLPTKETSWWITHESGCPQDGDPDAVYPCHGCGMIAAFRSPSQFAAVGSDMRPHLETAH